MDKQQYRAAKRYAITARRTAALRLMGAELGYLTARARETAGAERVARQLPVAHDYDLQSAIDRAAKRRRLVERGCAQRRRLAGAPMSENNRRHLIGHANVSIQRALRHRVGALD